MSDLVIRGMEMPKHCIDCPLMVNRYDTDACALQSQEANEAFESWDDMRRGCPLVPLPEGHGRLGDLDKINSSLEAMTEIEHNQKAAPYSWSCAYTEMQSILDDAPTIVPAEGGTDDVQKQRI